MLIEAENKPWFTFRTWDYTKENYRRKMRFWHIFSFGMGWDYFHLRLCCFWFGICLSWKDDDYSSVYGNLVSYASIGWNSKWRLVQPGEEIYRHTEMLLGPKTFRRKQEFNPYIRGAA